MKHKLLSAAPLLAPKLLPFAGTAVLLALSPAAFAQGGPQFTVDCVDPITPPYTNVFPNIGAYLQAIGPIGTVYVKGPCPGFTIQNGDQFTIIGPAEIDGNVTINDSPDAVYLQSLTITNTGGDGLDINGSKVTLSSCNVSNNAGNGVSIDNASFVRVLGTGSFDDNRASGFNVFGHSYLSFLPPGPVEIRRNKVTGITASQADVTTRGNMIVSDSGSGPGMNLLGGAHAQIGNAIGAPNLIQNNPNGGIQVLENSELSLWVCCSNSPNVVSKNGKFGISAGFHSQVTLSGADISNNAGPGVDVYGGSQVDFFPGSQNRISFNIDPTNAVTPGIRVNGNSEAWLRGSATTTNEISNNAGPGIQVLANSSLDFANLTMIGNTSPASCDFTSFVASDISLQASTGCIMVGRR